MLLTNNIMKDILNLDVAALFSFKGKTKLNFSKLSLSKCIISTYLLKARTFDRRKKNWNSQGVDTTGSQKFRIHKDVRYTIDMLDTIAQ